VAAYYTHILAKHQMILFTEPKDNIMGFSPDVVGHKTVSMSLHPAKFGISVFNFLRLNDVVNPTMDVITAPRGRIEDHVSAPGQIWYICVQFASTQ
jgi:hypothetical protein